MRRPRVAPLLLSLALIPLLAGAETRVWKSSTGDKSFTGSYVSHDATSVTIRREDGKTFKLERSKLHPEDLAWLKTQEEKTKPPAEPAPPEVPNAVFDTLCFGDEREVVMKKLKASRVVQGTIDETYFGRTGLNGAYQTKEKIGGLTCNLSFGWSDDKLTEITLQTQSVTADQYAATLNKTWTALAELMTNLHGKPAQAAAYPDRSGLSEGMFLASHLWHLEAGGSALMGTSMQDNAYQVIVRFSQQKVVPPKR